MLRLNNFPLFSNAAWRFFILGAGKPAFVAKVAPANRNP